MADRLVAVTVQAITTATVEQTFAVAVPIDLTLIFKRLGPLPAVVGTLNQTGSWDRVGASREPQLSDGTAAFEEITAYFPPSYFEYEVSQFTNLLRLLVSGARGDWKFTPTVAGGTTITWTYAFRSLRFRSAALRLLVAPLWRRYMQRALDLTVDEVHRQHPSQPSAVSR